MFMKECHRTIRLAKPTKSQMSPSSWRVHFGTQHISTRWIFVQWHYLLDRNPQYIFCSRQTIFRIQHITQQSICTKLCKFISPILHAGYTFLWYCDIILKKLSDCSSRRDSYLFSVCVCVVCVIFAMVILFVRILYFDIGRHRSLTYTFDLDLELKSWILSRDFDMRKNFPCYQPFIQSCMIFSSLRKTTERLFFVLINVLVVENEARMCQLYRCTYEHNCVSHREGEIKKIRKKDTGTEQTL